jgi:hypothetical protein
MAQQGREKMLFSIFVFFIVITTITGIFNLASSGGMTLGDLGNPTGQTIPGQYSPSLSIPGVNNGVVFGSQDYTTATGYSQNLTIISSEFLSGEMWSRTDGTGYESIYIPFYSPLAPQLAYLTVRGTIGANGIYDTTYHVYNQFDSYPFFTLIKGQEYGNGQIQGYYIRYDLDGVSLIQSDSPDTKLASVPYPYASDGQTIRTVFDSINGKVDVYIDGTEAATIPYDSLTGGSQYYTGVAASHAGFQISSVDGSFTTPATSGNLITDLINTGTGFLSLVGTMLGLTSNALVPFWFYSIFAVPCIATMIFIYIETVRGN